MNNLAKALIEFQAEITNVPFDAQNPHFKNKYASLAGIIDHVKPILHKHGMGFTQLVNKECVTTMLLHTSGESILAETSILCAQPNNPQAYGSAVTYARRYALTAILGISADDDDDGQSAKPPQRTPLADAINVSPAKAGMISEPQRKKMFALISEIGWTPEQAKAKMDELYHIDSSNKLTVGNAASFIDYLEKQKGDKK